MVSRFSYRSFKDRAAGERVRYTRFLIVPVVFALIALDPPLVLLGLFGGFALSAPIVWVWRRTHRPPRKPRGA
jgi:CDP-diacylglycerol--serine O-phosphatidyltransferase